MQLLLGPKILPKHWHVTPRETLRRLEHQPAEIANNASQSTFQRFWGLHFTDQEGEHFFRSSLVQTLFYGLFSAWVVWNRGNCK